MFGSNPYRKTAFKQKSTDLIGERHPALNPTLAHAVKRLQIELLFRLHWNEAHGRPQHRLAWAILTTGQQYRPAA